MPGMATWRCRPISGVAAQGPIEVKIVCHVPLSIADHGNRKTLAKQAEEAVRQGLVHALHGRAKMS